MSTTSLPPYDEAPATPAPGVPDAVAPPPGSPRFPLFDSLRAIAVLLVALTHAGLLSGANSLASYGAYTARMDVGVTVFFLISGFLLYRPLVSARLNGTPRPGWVDYARRRVLRIVPAYWLALTVLAVYPGLPQMWSDHSWAYYLLVQNLDSGWVFGGIGAAWSLHVEVTFYALLPLIAALMTRPVFGATREQRLRSEIALIAALYFGSLLIRGLTRAIAGEVSTVFITLPGTLDWFALGMGLAVASAALQGRERMPAPVRVVERWPSLAWATSLLLFWLLSTQLGLPRAFLGGISGAQWLLAHALYGLVAFFLLLPAVFGWEQPGGLPRMVLRNRVLSWLGLVSYGVFLWHLPVMGELSLGRANELWGSSRMLGITGVGLAIAIACATVSYYALERPVLRFKHRRLRSRASAPTG